MTYKIAFGNISFKNNAQIQKPEKKDNPSPVVKNAQPLAKPPVSTLLAYVTYRADSKNAGEVGVKFFNTLSVEQMKKQYGELAQKTAAELAQRAGKPNQVLNWIEVLPQTQLKRLDYIYAISDS